MSVGKSKVRSKTRPRLKLWTIKEYERMIDANLFLNKRAELIEGVIVEMPPMKSTHAATIGFAQTTLGSCFGAGYWLRIQMPLKFAPRSAPEPDLAVVLGSPRTYLASHPTTAALLVEISESSLSYDRNRKASLYARAGIADYWIINLVRRQLEIRRNPVPDPTRHYGFGYASVTILQPTDRATPLAAPQASILVADLLP